MPAYREYNPLDELKKKLKELAVTIRDLPQSSIKITLSKAGFYLVLQIHPATLALI